MTAEQAERLAKAIASDIVVYNDKEVNDMRATGRPGEKLAAAIQEGRELFLSRASSHRALFDKTISEALAAALTENAGTVSTAAAEASDVFGRQSMSGGSLVMLGVLGAVVVITAAVVAAMLF